MSTNEGCGLHRHTDMDTGAPRTNTKRLHVDACIDCPHAGPLVPPNEVTNICNNTTHDDDSHTAGTKLVVTFIAFVISGALFSVSAKLQAITMYNYPNFLNIFGCVLFVPLCFLYIIPAAKYGVIPPEQLAASKKPFAIMAIFDTLSSTMAVFSSIYLPGPLLVLLPQASIPISMVLSKKFLKTTYSCWQYLGATVVIAGILVVLEPVMSNRHAPDYVCVAVNEANDCIACEAEVTQEGCEGYADYGMTDILLERSQQMFGNTTLHACQWIKSSHETSGTSTLLFWACILLLSCLPLSMSSIYKERKLSEFEFDPVYLNGWLCFFQTPLSALLAIPGGIVSSPPVLPSQLPDNMWEGMKCFLGKESISNDCHPDDCRYALLAMCGFTLICFVYVNLMVLLLKFGSANLLFLALTLVVPVANLAFALPFMPNRVALHASDLIGLFVIMAGITSYRFGSALVEKDSDGEENEMQERGSLIEPLLSIEELGMEAEVVSTSGDKRETVV